MTLKELQTEVNELRTDLEELEHEFHALKVHVYRIEERQDTMNDVLAELARETARPGFFTRAHTFVKNLAYLAKNTTPTGIRLDLLDYEDEQ